MAKTRTKTSRAAYWRKRISQRSKKLESLSFRHRFDILLEKRPSGVAGLRYTMLYGKC